MKTMLKTTLAVASALYISAVPASQFGTTVSDINVVTYSKEGGNGWQWANMFKDILNEEGYNAEFVSTGNCHNLTKFMNGTSKPTVFFHGDISINSAEALGCSVEPSNENFEGVLFSRVNTMCVRKEDAKPTAMDHFAGRDEITIALHSDLDPILMETLGEELGVSFKQVQYGGSSKVMRGLLAGDTEMLYTGLTKREATNEGLHCFTTTSDSNIGDQVPLKTLAPNYEFSGLKSYWYVYMHGMNAEQRKSLWADLINMTESNETLRSFISTSGMVPGTELTDVTREDLIENRFKWK